MTRARAPPSAAPALNYHNRGRGGGPQPSPLHPTTSTAMSTIANALAQASARARNLLQAARHLHAIGYRLPVALAKAPAYADLPLLNPPPEQATADAVACSQPRFPRPTRSLGLPPRLPRSQGAHHLGVLPVVRPASAAERRSGPAIF